jgi:hypothetical protein
MIEQLELSKIFEYRDGELWRKSHIRSNGRIYKAYKIRKSGACNGYTLVRLNTENVILYHRIIWILHNGNIPEGKFIDHIDGNKLNNSIENLRLVTHRENCQNFTKHRNGKLVGCSFDKRRNKWQSQLWYNGKRKHLGYFNTMEEAHRAYIDFLNPR